MLDWEHSRVHQWNFLLIWNLLSWVLNSLSCFSSHRCLHHQIFSIDLSYTDFHYTVISQGAILRLPVSLDIVSLDYLINYREGFRMPVANSDLFSSCADSHSNCLDISKIVDWKPNVVMSPYFHTLLCFLLNKYNCMLIAKS